MNNIHSHNNHFFIYFEKQKRSSRLNTQQLCFLTPRLDDTRHIVPSSPAFIIPPVFTQAFLFEFFYFHLFCLNVSSIVNIWCVSPKPLTFFSFSLFLSQLLCNDVRLCVIFEAKTYFEELSFLRAETSKSLNYPKSYKMHRLFYEQLE